MRGSLGEGDLRHADALRNGGEGGGRQGGHALRRAGGGERQRAHDDAPRELDLEGVVAGGPGVRERRLGGAPEARGAGAAPARTASAARRAPGLRGDAAEREPRLAILPPSMRSAAAAETTAKA